MNLSVIIILLIIKEISSKKLCCKKFKNLTKLPNILSNFNHKFPHLKSLNLTFCENSSKLMEIQTKMEASYLFKAGTYNILK